MREEKRRLWKLKVGLKAKSFDFKLKLQRALPSWAIHRLSFRLNIRKHSLKLESESFLSNFKNPKPKFKFRLIRNLIFLDFLRKSKPKNRELAVTNTSGIKSKEAIRACSYSIALLIVFLFHSITDKERFIHGSALILCGILMFMTFKAGRWNHLLLVVMILTTIFSSTIGFGSSFDQFTRIFKCLLDHWESGFKLNY